MKTTAPEVRDWLAAAAAGVGLYLDWRRRSKGSEEDRSPQGRHIVLELHDSVTVSDAVTVGKPQGITVGIAQEIDLALPITPRLG